MALTPSSVKRPVVLTGDDLSTQKLSTGEHAQGVAVLGESGEHIGGVTNPLVVTVENQTAVGGRVVSDRDLFGRERASAPYTMFESVLEYDLRLQLWGDGPILNTGTVTHLPAESAAALTVAAGQSVTRVSHEHFKYQAGKPNLAYLTANIGSAAGTVRRVGYFDDFNGVFFMNDGITNSFVVRSSVTGVVVETVIPQSLWNVDKLDGFGTSGFTLDLTKVQIVVVEVQGMGAGEIRVGFNIDAHTTYCHEFHGANLSAHTLLHSDSLPVCYQIDSTTGIGTLEQYDTSVIAEGGRSLAEDSGMIFSASTGALGKLAPAILSPVISIRPALLFKTLEYHGSTIVNDIQLLSDSTNIYWEVVLNPVLTGPIWTAANIESATEYDITATASLGGAVLLSGYSERKGSSGFSLPLQKLAMTAAANHLTSDIITLNVVDIQLKGGNVFASMNFSESY